MLPPASSPHPAPLRLLYAGAVLLILVLLATSATVVVRLRESALLDEEGDQKNLSLIMAEQADRLFQSVDLVISSVAQKIARDGVTDAASFERKLSGRDVYLTLRERITGIQQLDAVVVINRDGKVINFSRSWPAPSIDNADRDYFIALKADPSLKSYISRPVRNHGSGTWSIFLARRISGENGEFLGIVLGTIELRYFEDFYAAISLSEGSSIVLQRLDGVMLARVPPTDAIGKVFADSQYLLRGGSSRILHEPSPIDGKMRIKAVHLLANYPVVALATKTEEATLASWRSIVWLISLGALGCASAIAVAAFALGRQWRQHAILAHAQAELRRQEDRAEAFEAMKAAKEAAETADRGKSEFLATMSHELRTPLNAVLGFSEMMLREVYGPLGSDHYRDYARDIHSSGSHLLGIISDVLDLSKAAAGKFTLDQRWVDAREVVSTVCRLVQPRLSEASLSLAVNLPPGDLIIYADERVLKQMVLNLLSNACKFTPPDGRVECSVSVDAAEMTFAVTDTGIGIPAEHLARVLRPFVQVDSSLSRRHEGTGLGLALVKVMAELHGGCLRLDSKIGSGTTAAVILPIGRAKSGCTDISPETAVSASTAERLIA
jgi:signal transduction histidine kinase